MRLVNAIVEVHCLLKFAKSRRAPLKCVSIPRLELSPATIFVRQDRILKREIEISLSAQSVFWNDGISVLLYLKNESKCFHTFVANRIAIIRDCSSPDHWYHIKGILNPGNCVSRGLSAETLNCEKWLSGPEFACTLIHQWSIAQSASMALEEDDPEVKRYREVKYLSTTITPVSVTAVTALSHHFQKFADWYRLDFTLSKQFLIGDQDSTEKSAGKDSTRETITGINWRIGECWKSDI